MADATQICALCQDTLHDPTQRIAGLACSHLFHNECLEEYYRRNGKPRSELVCPECRKSERDLIADGRLANEVADDISAPTITVPSTPTISLLEEPDVIALLDEPAVPDQSNVFGAPLVLSEGTLTEHI